MLVANGVTQLRDEVETVSNAFGRAYVRQTDAIWIISEGVVAEDVADGHLMLLPVDSSETTGPVGLTTRTDMVSTLAAESLKQAVRDAAASLR
jgi:LysR family pca operon transcriptional activator